MMHVKLVHAKIPILKRHIPCLVHLHAYLVPKRAEPNMINVACVLPNLSCLARLCSAVVPVPRHPSKTQELLADHESSLVGRSLCWLEVATNPSRSTNQQEAALAQSLCRQ